MVMKNISRNNRFFLCFRPVPIDVELESERGCSDDVIGNKGGIANLSSRVKSSGSQTYLSCPFLAKRTVSRMFKAMLRRSVGGTKGSRRRSRRSSIFHPHETKHSSSKPTVRVDSIDHEDDGEVMSNCSTSVSTCSATSSSSLLETSRPLYVKDKDIVEHPCGNKYSKYLFVMSLAMTIFGGRVCGIFFTSIWMYLSFHRRRRDGDKRRQEIMGRRLIEARLGRQGV